MTKRGMTLVEVLIAVAIFAVVMIAIGTFEVNIFSYNSSISGSFNTAQNAQTILKTILKELREMAPGANGSYPIVTAGTTTLSFFSDPDNDGVTEQITYSLSNNTLYRSIIQPSGSPLAYNPASQTVSSLVADVRNDASLPVFQYFDANYNGTSSPLTLPASLTAIRLIKISLSLDADPNRLPLPVIYTVQANLRNIKNNL
ncbi:MAG: prepilin-type N-terminal cleavage/methylation domain-containing protein [Candidatus Omnitrophota bacterium]|jgi:prepilin-type N-terminal cleavage/methylation domain-containing protein